MSAPLAMTRVTKVYMEQAAKFFLSALTAKQEVALATLNAALSSE